MALAFALFAALVTGGLFLWGPDYGKTLSSGNGTLGAALVGGAVIAFVVFLTEQQSQLESDRREVSHQLVARWDVMWAEDNLQNAYRQVIAFTDAGEQEKSQKWRAMTPEEKWQKWHVVAEDPQRVATYRLLSLCEDIGESYNEHAANRKMIKRRLGRELPKVWDRLDFVVLKARKDRSQLGFYNQFQDVARKFKKDAKPDQTLETFPSWQ